MGKKKTTTKPRKKLSTLLKQGFSTTTDIAVYAGGAALSLSTLNEGSEGSRTVTQAIKDKMEFGEIMKSAGEGTREGIKRGQFWLGIGIPATYEVGKAVLRKIKSSVR